MLSLSVLAHEQTLRAVNAKHEQANNEILVLHSWLLERLQPYPVAYFPSDPRIQPSTSSAMESCDRPAFVMSKFGFVTSCKVATRVPAGRSLLVVTQAKEGAAPTWGHQSIQPICVFKDILTL